MSKKNNQDIKPENEENSATSQPNILTIYCAGNEFSVPLSITSNSPFFYKLTDTIVCYCLFTEKEVILITDCTLPIKVQSTNLSVQHIFISTKGHIEYDITNSSKLYCQIEANQIDIHCPLQQCDIAFLRTPRNPDSYIMLRADSACNTLVLETTALKLDCPKLRTKNAYIKCESILSNTENWLEVKSGDQTTFEDPYNLLYPEFIVSICKQSLIEVGNFPADMALTFQHCQVITDLLPTQGFLDFQYTTINCAELNITRNSGSKWLISNCDFTVKTLCSDGNVDIICSDVFFTSPVIFAEKSHLKIYASTVCGSLVHVHGTVEGLVTHESDPNKSQYFTSRLISSDEFSSAHGQRELYLEANKDKITEKPEDAVPVFVDEYHLTPRHTSIKRLRDFIYQKTNKTSNQNLRSFNVNTGADSSLEAIIIALIYTGILENKREKVAIALTNIFLPQGENTKETAEEKYEISIFKEFIVAYQHALYPILVEDLDNKYLNNEAKGYALINELCKRLRKNIEQHAGGTNAKDQRDRIDTPLFASNENIKFHYIGNYLASLGFNLRLNQINGKTIVYGNKKNVLYLELLNSNEPSQKTTDYINFQPAIQTAKIPLIVLPPCLNLKHPDDSHLFYEIMAIMNYCTNMQLSSNLTAEMQEKVAAASKRLFNQNRDNKETGTLYIGEKATITGDGLNLYSTGYIINHGKISLHNILFYARCLENAPLGIIDAKSIHSELLSMWLNSGKISANRHKIDAEFVIGCSKSATAGTNNLDINSLVYILSNSYLYSTNLSIRSFIALNFGIQQVFNSHIDSMINFDGIYFPCLPQSSDDLWNLQKLIILMKMGLAFLSSELAIFCQTVLCSYSLGNTIWQINNMYNSLHDKAWKDLTRKEVAAIFIKIVTVSNEGHNFYRSMPSTAQGKGFMGKASNSASSFKEWAQQVVASIQNNGSVSARSFLSSCKNGIQRNINDLHIAFSTGSASLKQTLNTHANTLRGLKESGFDISKLPPINPHLIDITGIFAPLYSVNAAVDLRGGLSLTGNRYSQNGVALASPGAKLSMSDTNCSIFFSGIAPGSFNVTDDYSSFVLGTYTKYGQTIARNWHVTARDFNEHGNTHAPNKILHIGNNAYFANGSNFSGANRFSGHIGNNLIIAGNAELSSGSLNVDRHVHFTDTSTIDSADFVLFAKDGVTYDGTWNYNDILYVETGHLASTRQSVLVGTEFSTGVFRAKTESLQGSAHHYSVFYDIAEMPAARARDLAYQKNDFSHMQVGNSISVATESTDDIEYLGLRADNAKAELYTQGRVYLPSSFTRANGDYFTTYNQADVVAKNYHDYKVPPPAPKKDSFLKKVGKGMSKVLGKLSAIFTNSGTHIGVALGAATGTAAAGINEAVNSSDRRENRRLEEANSHILEGQHRIESGMLDSDYHSAQMSLLLNQAHKDIQSIVNGQSSSRDDILLKENLAKLQDTFNAAQASLQALQEGDIARLRTHYSDFRRLISQQGSTTIGMGGAINHGVTGTSVRAIITTGPQNNPVRSSMELASFDKPSTPRQPTKIDVSTTNTPTTSHQDSNPNTHIYQIDEEEQEQELPKVEATTFNTSDDTRQYKDKLSTDSLEKQIFNQKQDIPQPLINIQPELGINLEANFIETLLVGMGSGYVTTFRGIRQLAQQCGVTIGILHRDSLETYTAHINREHTLYNATPVGNSKTGKVGEFLGTMAGEMLIFLGIPGSTSVKGYKVVVSGAKYGAVAMAIQPVYDGTLTSRLQNALVGAGTGAVMAPLAHKSGKAIVALFKSRANPSRWFSGLGNSGGSNTKNYFLFRKNEITSASLNKLAEPIDQTLITRLEKKGWTIEVAKKGSDDLRWLNYNNADACINSGVPKHILIRDGAPKSALLEEILHAKQLELGLLEKYGTHQALEVHVKDFMLRHSEMLGLNNPHDIRLLQQLKIEELNRLNKLQG